MMKELARIALVGTSKHAAAEATDVDHPAEALVADVATENREHVFLLRAGSRAVFEQCGRMARADVAPLQPCPPETRPFASQKLVGPLQAAIASESWELLCEYLRHLRALEHLVPPELLPQALAICDADVRECLLPVLGERGRWLSAFSDAWRWVTSGVGAISTPDRDALLRQWEEGTINERCQALRMLRRGDSSDARQRLEATLATEKADHRARLIQAVETGLVAEDEPFLESRLDDRSEQVRRVAASLLARIPNSAITQRMRERAATILTAQSQGLLRKKLKLVCQPPEEIDKTWERDGVSRKAPGGRGKRDFWTESVLSAVPPSFWSRLFEAEPADLIQAILNDDYSQAVLSGWTRAAATFAAQDEESAAWLRPLWDHWLDRISHRGKSSDKAQPSGRERLQELLTAMPNADEALLPALKACAARPEMDVLDLLPLLSRPWSASFAREFLTTLRFVLQRQTGNRGYQWAAALSLASRALPPETLDAALAPWKVAGEGSANWHTQHITREIGKFTATIQARQSFYDMAAR